MSISIQCANCGRPVVCETGTVTIGSFLTCGACGHTFECRGKELRAALKNIEKRIQEIPHPVVEAAKGTTTSTEIKGQLSQASSVRGKLKRLTE